MRRNSTTLVVANINEARREGLQALRQKHM